MSETRHFIGVDPGPIPGMVHLERWGGDRFHVDVIQCTPAIAPLLLWTLLDQARTQHGEAPAVVAVEKFVVGRGSMRSGAAGSVTRHLIGQFQQTLEGQRNVKVVQRSASEVKPWATDDRLAHANLLEPTKGMRHARDAARHALFAAVKDGGLPDPLSRKARA